MTPSIAILNLGHSTLGIARALAPLRVPVIAFAHRTTSYGEGSRYLKVIRAPDSAEQNGLPLRDFLVKFFQGAASPTALFPTRDLDVVFIDNHRSVLEQHFVLAQPKHDALDVVINKSRLIAAAKDFGLTIPRTLQFDPALETAQRIPDDFRYPVIIKPIYAHQPRARGIRIGTQLTKAHVAHSRNDALSHVDLLTTKGISVFLQEFIPGDTDRLLICGGHLATDDRYTAAFTARKRIQYPHAAGIGRAVETIDDPRLAETTLSFLKSIGYHGIFEAEYKQDQHGIPHLIEINPRHWDQHLLGTACGVDVSALAISYLLRSELATHAYRFKHAIWYDDPFLVRSIFDRDPNRRALNEERRTSSPKPLRMTSVLSLRDPLPAVYAYSRLAMTVLRGLVLRAMRRVSR